MRSTSVSSELNSLYNQEDELRRRKREQGAHNDIMLDNDLATVRAEIRKLEGKPPYNA